MRSVFTRPGVYGSESFRVVKSRRFHREILARSCSLWRPSADGKKYMDEQTKFQIEIRERLTAIETMLKDMDFKSVEQVADHADNQAQRNAEDIAKLQAAQTWIVRTIIGAIISAVMAFILIK